MPILTPFFALLVTAAPLLAHFPEGEVYKIFQFPDEKVPAMDGDLGDWDVVPDEYFFDYTYYAEMHRDSSAIDTTDHYVKRVAVGWNDTHNRLYFMAEVYDDVYRFQKPPAHLDSLDTVHSRLTGAIVHGSDMRESLVDARDERHWSLHGRRVGVMKSGATDEAPYEGVGETGLPSSADR